MVTVKLQLLLQHSCFEQIQGSKLECCTAWKIIKDLLINNNIIEPYKITDFYLMCCILK